MFFKSIMGTFWRLLAYHFPLSHFNHAALSYDNIDPLHISHCMSFHLEKKLTEHLLEKAILVSTSDIKIWLSWQHTKLPTHESVYTNCDGKFLRYQNEINTQPPLKAKVLDTYEKQSTFRLCTLCVSIFDK